MKSQPLARLVNQHELIFAIDSATADTSYRVNLKLRTCTCPDFEHRRSKHGMSAPERACKHQVAVAQQAPFLLAALKAKKLSDAQLVAAIQHYQETDKQHVAGAARCELARRKQAANRDAKMKAVFS